MNYIDNPRPYDEIKIAGKRLPGEVSYGEVKRELSKKHKRGSGNDGAEPTYGGLKPTSLTIKCVLHTADDEEEWIKLSPLMMSISHPERRNQVSIENPQLARMGITRCAVHAISETQPKGKPLEVSISIDSVAVKTGATHKPKQTSGSLPFTLFPGSPFSRTTGLPTAAALRARTLTALQQNRLDNGIPIDISRDPSDFPGAVQDKQINKTNTLSLTNLSTIIFGG
jgi:hypothetical protein